MARILEKGKTYLIIQEEPSSESLVHTRNLTGPQRAVVWSASTLFALNNEAKSIEPGSEASAILAWCRLPEYPGGLGFGFHSMSVLRNFEMFSFFLVLTNIQKQFKAAQLRNIINFIFLNFFLISRYKIKKEVLKNPLWGAVKVRASFGNLYGTDDPKTRLDSLVSLPAICFLSSFKKIAHIIVSRPKRTVDSR